LKSQRDTNILLGMFFNLYTSELLFFVCYSFEFCMLFCSIFSRYGIHSLPSVLMVNGTSRVRYRGPKNLDSLVKFYKKTTGKVLSLANKKIYMFYLVMFVFITYQKVMFVFICLHTYVGLSSSYSYHNSLQCYMNNPYINICGAWSNCYFFLCLPYSENG